jgi:phosphatidylserine decarboxylase
LQIVTDAEQSRKFLPLNSSVVSVVRRTASALTDVFLREDINFLVTNRIPRRYATLLMGRLAQIRSRQFTKVAVAAWSLFDDLRLDEAKTRDFISIQDCFTRELCDGARHIDQDPHIVISPCDAVIGAFGVIRGNQAIQAKGFPYSIEDLLGDQQLIDRHREGKFVTLRLRASMYHRFHAPCDAHVRRVRYISGDTWNVNPVALKRVQQLFCKNERAVIPLELSVAGSHLTLVPIAAILVASIRLHFVPTPLNLRYTGATEIPCDGRFKKGVELGYFENGSTIVMFASNEFEFTENVVEGKTIRVGEPILRHPLPISQNLGDNHERFN